MPKFKCPAETCISSKTYRGENIAETVQMNYKDKLQIAITFIRICFPKFVPFGLSFIIFILLLK